MESLLLDDEMKKELETEWDLLNHTDITNSSISENEDKPTPEHLNVLSKCFGHKKFRPMQWKIINSIINERRDNCAIMTTGYGKSLCYQFPAVYMGGMALVISPLISLMEDQVLAMQVSNISACLLGTANKEQRKTIDEIFENKYSLIYLTPEFCTGDFGKELLQKIYAQCTISLVAVDEAHCVSSWGHDFRFQYRHLDILKDLMPGVPILAVTATATQKVRDDIIKTLKLQNPQITCSGFDRPNLHFSVHLKSSNILGDLRRVMQRKDGQWKFSGSTIIYCITRRQTEEISLLLNESGIKCLPYHAGLSLSVRKDTHEQFVRDKVEVIVATIAFGMGIDKPDVRNIIHYGASNSIEAYYQEVGRAGRDGLPALCCAFYSNRDFDILRFLKEKTVSYFESKINKDKMLDTMREYLSTTECRRQFILSYFEDKKVSASVRCCDNCSKTSTDSAIYEGVDDSGRYDFTEDAITFLNAVNALNGKFGVNMYVHFLRGSRMNKLTNYVKHVLHGSGKNKSEAWWKGIAVLLEKEKYLKKIRNAYQNFSCTLCVSDRGEMFLKDAKRKLLVHPIPELMQCLKTKANVWLSTVDPPQPSTSAFPIVKEDKCTQFVMKLYHLLMNKRHELATSQDCMPYTIASNTALMEMAKQQPLTVEQLRTCQLEGFTEAKIMKFGGEFVQTIRFALNLTTDQPKGKMSIQDVFYQHPLFEIKCTPSANTTYSLFKAGLTVHEISKKRGVVESTVTSHLIDLMKLGYPIKLVELEITNEIKNIIEDAITKVDTGMSLLLPIKNICPPDITYNQIKAVVTYLQIRQHLKNLNIPYDEFDEIDSPMDVPTQSAQSSETNVTNGGSVITSWQPTPTQNLKELINEFDKIDKHPSNEMDWAEDNSNFSGGFNDEILSAACDELETSINEKEEISHIATTENSSGQHSQVMGKEKEPSGFNFSVLDSPPRQTKSQETGKEKEPSGFYMSVLDSPPRQTQEKRKIEESRPKTSKNNKKLKLPPWLVPQRLA